MTINKSVGGYRITGYWNKYAGTYIVYLKKSGKCAYGGIRLKAGDQALSYNIRANVRLNGGKRYYGDIKDAVIYFYVGCSQ